MKDRFIVVTAEDKAVTINGERYVVDCAWPEGLVSIDWNPGRKKMPGHISKKGDAHGFREFKVVAPFIAPWEAAKGAAETERTNRERAVRAGAELANAHRKGMEDARKALEEDQRAFVEAMNLLADTDHEILKAVEGLLENTDLKPLLDKRRAARAVAKAEKRRLLPRG